VADAAAIRGELLRQLCRPVLWQRSVEYMVGEGVTGFVEIGPGRVLTSLIRRINGGVKIWNVGDVASIRRLAEDGITLGGGHEEVQADRSVGKAT